MKNRVEGLEPVRHDDGGAIYLVANPATDGKLIAHVSAERARAVA